MLTNVVERGAPFQLTTDPVSKFVPVTVTVKPAGLQYAVEVGEIDVIVGPAAAGVLIVKGTTFDTSVVFVAYMFEEPETAEPGI